MTRSAERTILHVDMDAFFASVEIHDDPALRGRPVLVGYAGRGGVVLAASYEARPFGARSAMPMAEAMRRCPQAVVVPPRHERYAEVSRRVFAVLHDFTPLVEPLSVDEAFLDVTGSRSLFGDGPTIARRIKDAVASATGLTASAGVAPNKFIAKIASDLGKPDGLLVVPSSEACTFLEPLPIERMWGVGPKTAPKLRTAGICTLGDLARGTQARLERLLGSSWARLRDFARGIDERPVIPEREAKSIGAESTFAADITAKDELVRHLLEQSARVAHRLSAAGLSTRAVAIKLKYDDFRVATRRVTLSEPVRDTDSIYEAAKDLLARFERQRPVRLSGVSACDLVRTDAEPTLFADPRTQKRQRVEDVTERITQRFGAHRLTRASLLDTNHERLEGSDVGKLPPRATVAPRSGSPRQPRNVAASTERPPQRSRK